MKFAGEASVCVFLALQLGSMVKHVKCDHTLVLISAYRERHPFHTLPEMGLEITFAAARFCQCKIETTFTTRKAYNRQILHRRLISYARQPVIDANFLSLRRFLLFVQGLEVEKSKQTTPATRCSTPCRGRNLIFPSIVVFYAPQFARDMTQRVGHKGEA
jgi:hypothetical protein